jgi:hypothetical protein
LTVTIPMGRHGTRRERRLPGTFVTIRRVRGAEHMRMRARRGCGVRPRGHATSPPRHPRCAGPTGALTQPGRRGRSLLPSPL